jgi:guanylate kinase
MLVEQDSEVEFSISHTTRPMRPGERDGHDYHFVDRQEFAALLAADAFVEHAEYADNLYGTSWTSIDEPLGRGRDLLLEVEVQGALQIRERRSDARFVFLLPPSMEELERRLRGRGTDSEEAVARRLALVRRELAAVHAFDYALVNEDVEATTRELAGILKAERSGDPSAALARHGRAAVVSRMAAVLPMPE